MHIQGFRIGSNIEIFMPIYEGSLHDLIKQYKSGRPGSEQHEPGGPEVVPQKVRDMTDRMLSQILDALDSVHTHEPQIIHRDIKPANILYQDQGNKFLLTDFGIAKVVDTSKTMIGTQWYAAPEIHQSCEQTPKVDVYSLGVTVLECLVGLKPEAEMENSLRYWSQWHEYLQMHLNKHAPQYASMLAYDPDRRPTARKLLNAFFRQPVRASLQSPPPNSVGIGCEISSIANQADTAMNSAAPSPMDWTKTVATAIFHENFQTTRQNKNKQPLQPDPMAPKALRYRPAQPGIGREGSFKSARSTEERQKQGYKRSGSSQNGRNALIQYGGVPKRTSSRKRRSKSSINKALAI